jgi:nitrite reductase/ring-hydroxylating ferredoxin subunit
MPRWVKLATLDQLPPGGALEVEHEGRIVALFNIEGNIRALDGVCPHQGGPLAEGTLEGSTVTCPWHGWQFDTADGRCLTGRPMNQPVYEVTIDGRDVLVDVP